MMSMQEPAEPGGKSPKRPRLRIPGLVSNVLEGTTTWSLGQVCHDHVLADLYATLDATGEIVSIEAVAVGSC